MGGYNQEMNNGQYDYGGSSSLNPFGDDSWGDKAIAPIVPGGPVSILPGTKYLPGMSKIDGWVGEKVFGKGGEEPSMTDEEWVAQRAKQRLANVAEFNRTIMSGGTPNLFGTPAAGGGYSSPYSGNDTITGPTIGPPMTTDPSNMMTGGMSSQMPALNMPQRGTAPQGGSGGKGGSPSA